MIKPSKNLQNIFIIILILIIVPVLIYMGLGKNKEKENNTNNEISNNILDNNDKEEIEAFKGYFDMVSSHYPALIGLIDLYNEIKKSDIPDNDKQNGLEYINGKMNSNLLDFKSYIENMNIPQLKNIHDKNKLEKAKQEMLKGTTDISNRNFPDLSLKGISDINNVIISYLPTYQNNTIFILENNNMDQVKQQLLNLFTQENLDFNNLYNQINKIADIEEKKIDELEFNIVPKYLGDGEIEINIHSNLQNTSISFDVFSISKLSEAEEYMGIDYSKWYTTILDYEDRNYNMNSSSGNKDTNDLETNDNGNIFQHIVMYHSETKNHSYSEIDSLKSSKLLKDNTLASNLEHKQIFEKDKRVILDYRIHQNDLKNMNIDELKLPSYCEINTITYAKGSTAKEIKCIKELNTGKVETSSTESYKEKKKLNIASYSSKPYINYLEAKKDCMNNGSKLPSKEQVKNNYDELKTLFKNSKILYTWTSKEQNKSLYAWIESVNDTAGNSNWATIDSKSRDYIGYVCVK